MWYLLRVQARLNAEPLTEAEDSARIIAPAPSTASVPTADAPAAPVVPTDAAPRDWLDDLITSVHTLVIGGIRGGKTILTHHLSPKS